MNPQDALEAIFEEIAKIYVKLCEVNEVFLSISMNALLLGLNGTFINQSVAFNNLDTDPNPDIQALISDQITDFNNYISQLLQAKRALLDPDQQNLSDCEVLKICGKTNSINGLWSATQDVAASPQETSANLADSIGKIKALLDFNAASIPLLSFVTEEDLFNLDGNLSGQNITFDNYDTDSNSDIEQSIIDQINTFIDYTENLIGTVRLTLSGDLQNGTGCQVLNICDSLITINGLWKSAQRVIAPPQEITQILADKIIEIKKIFDAVEETDPIIDFTVPIIWTDKGRLNIDPNSYPIILSNPNNDSEVTDKQTEINDVFGDFLEAINIALGNTTSPVS